MFGLGTQELIIILIIVLVIFGAGKLPQVGGALGKGIRNFKKGMNDDSDDQDAQELKRLDDKDSADKDTNDKPGPN
ncbi:sec-independent protein translocase protein TatA [Geothermobacter ehrlichii]|uniref:Sec-independent protein translocase protein TatA n=1 Tax=Geothermobacter ehrlichii TaxID=213224 RepID=A0A5D3WNZ1_9BACT|nr:twin-arginine translocase TatA/TatE family subunit [Geothermobacter ehrlichii]TYO99079.1 sec-independent protein translocase protein TatA [Geothermobacter ehrlichii]